MTDGIIGTLTSHRDHCVLVSWGLGTHHQNERTLTLFDPSAARLGENPGGLGDKIPSTRLASSNSTTPRLPFPGCRHCCREAVVALLLRSVFGATNHHREKGLAIVGHNHADRLSFLFDQATGNQVGTFSSISGLRYRRAPEVLADD